MIEFIFVVLVTTLFLLLIGFAFSKGRSPAYRPSREEVLVLIHGIQDKSTSPQAWDMFIGYPIHHDPELEAIRRALVELHEGLQGDPPLREGINGYIYDRLGREKVARIEVELIKLIEQSPITREF